MIYSSPSFLFFLAFALLGYWSCKPALRKYALLLISTAWYAWWNPAWPLLAALLSLMHFAAIRTSRGFQVLVCFDFLLLVILKAAPAWLLGPLGFGIILLSLLSYLVDFHRNPQRRPPVHFTDLFLSATFFPLLMGGPVERYEELAPQIQNPGPLRAENVVDGILIFALGFMKKVLLADRLAQPAETFWAAQKTSLLGVALAGLFFIFRFYLDFASYCDMGRGVARCFGIRLQANFRPILFSANPPDYWRRWNISIGTWLRDYVTLPALLRFGRAIPVPLILMFSFLLMGLWHGFSLTWLIFGLYNGSLIAIYVAAESGPLLRHPRALRALGYILVVFLGAGNGIIQAADGFHRLSAISAWSFLWPVLPGWTEILLGLPPILILLLVEWIQEKKHDLDFYLALRFPLRALAAGIFLAWFLVSLRQGAFSGPAPHNLPQYFRL
jgi:alginate O-acetyltransferase complex protein AlgI